VCPLQKKMIAKELLSQVGGGALCNECFPVLGAHPQSKRPHALPPLTPTVAPTLQKEIDWVDAYHRQVWEALSPRLEGQQEELEWLRQATSPL
jgi:hypothetical protein